MLHIAQFVQRYPPAIGGSEFYLARLTDDLARSGDRVTIWTSTAHDLGEMWRPAPRPTTVEPTGPVCVRRYRPLGFPGRRYAIKALSLVPVPRWQAWTLPCNPICPAMLWDVDRFAEPVDAVHATAFPYTFPIACGLRLARRRQVPFFLTPFLHLGDPGDPHDRTRRQYTQPVLRWLLQQADGVFVQTAAERQAAIELGVSPARVILQGLGVEPQECTGGDRTAARAAWGVAEDECVIGHLANLSAEKGTLDLLAAQTGQAVVLAGAAMPNFERVWPRLPQPHRVRRLGVLEDHQKRDFFAGIDLFCLPSRTDSFGLVLLEAWANRKPVLVYRAGGPAELVRDGIDGIVTDCTPAALRAGLIRLRDRDTREQLGEAGLQRVLREFRWSEKLRLVRDTIQQTCRNFVKIPRENHAAHPDRSTSPVT